MASKVQYPIKGKVIADGDIVRLTGEDTIVGIKVYNVTTLRGKDIGTMRRDAIVAYPNEHVK